ncbi:molecular chaperone TorD family protein [Oxalobacteraceae bacterium R-40]|uniref:Molecular chaperone TorD family protein n=1 Tax=Keguizhuia sedimenti TaxID=3064264 RepID=A0ABU1BL18_9BURK|nr:molecular chaperone TorD family protein [Oxalobacteraceae bacterium R-40]
MKPTEQEIFTSSHVRHALTPEDQARADWYALLARLFYSAPDDHLLKSLAQADALEAQSADSALDVAWEQLTTAASILEADAVSEEFSALFISVGTPQVNPYASLYLSGFMMEKPLASLRSDLAAMGLARADKAIELEDHLAALCETMRLMVAGAPAWKPRPVQEQRAFFMKHIAPWYARCLDDVRNAKGANFYRKVADLAQAFFEIEYQAFELEDESPDELLLQ